MYLLIIKFKSFILKKINLRRAKTCRLGYYLTTLVHKPFKYTVLRVVTPLKFMAYAQLTTPYYKNKVTTRNLHLNSSKSIFNKVVSR